MVTPVRRSPNLSEQRGIALAMALMGIVLIGALVSGTLFAARMEMISGRNTVLMGQATAAAETGVADAFANWDVAWNQYDIGGDSLMPTVVTAAGARYTNSVRRLKGGLYEVTSLGEKADRGGNVVSSRLLAELGKLVTPDISVQAAVTSKADVKLNGTADVSGFNFTPAGWDACGSYADVAGIKTGGEITKKPENSVGDPPYIENDVSVTTASIQSAFDAFLPMVSKTLSSDESNIGPTTTGSPARCDTQNPKNWGEPRRGPGSVPECENYFPVLYAPGDLRVNQTVGQGVLLVGGDLDLHGNFTFYGLVIVMGTFTTSGTDNVYGGVLVGNEVIDENVINGNVLVRYSGCAIQKALAGTARGVPLTERKWAQVNP